MKNAKPTKKQTKKTSNKNSRGHRTNTPRPPNERTKKQDTPKTITDESPKNNDDKQKPQLQQENQNVDGEITRRLCAGHGINPNCAGFLPVNSRRHRKWCDESCRMYVNYQTRPQYKKRTITNKNTTKTHEINKVQKLEVDEVSTEGKSAAVEGVKKVLTESKDPLLNFVGNNGEMIVNIVKEFWSGFKEAKQAQQPQQQLTQQTPQPPEGYGKLAALQYKNDPDWNKKAQQWEAYLKNSPHGHVNVAIPQPTQHSVQRGNPQSVVEQSGARTLADLQGVSKQLDAQTPISQPPPVNASGLTNTEEQNLEEYRKDNDPLKDKITTKQPQETEVNTTTERDNALIEEKLQLLIDLFNSLPDDTVNEYAKEPEKAIEKINSIIQKPMVAMMLKSYIPVIKQVGMNEFKGIFEENCKEKLSKFSADEKETFLVKLDEWRQNL